VGLVVAEVVEVGKLTHYKTFNKTSVLPASRSFFYLLIAQVNGSEHINKSNVFGKIIHKTIFTE